MTFDFGELTTICVPFSVVVKVSQTTVSYFHEHAPAFLCTSHT